VTTVVCVLTSDQLLKVYGHCGGSAKITACIEDRNVIDTILAHLREKEQRTPPCLPWHHFPATTRGIDSFHREGFRQITVQPSGTPLSDSWHRLLCANERAACEVKTVARAATN